MTTLIDLKRAKQKVRQLEKELDEYAESQYRDINVIEKQPAYRQKKAELLRAKSVVRSLTRKARQ